MFKKVDRQAIRKVKHVAIRKKISGTAEKPRLSVYKSNNNIFAQLIDDVNKVTIAAASTIDKELKGNIKHGGNVESAKLVGKLIGERAISKSVTTVVFDRAGSKYTGRIAALADAAREAGLKF